MQSYQEALCLLFSSPDFEVWFRVVRSSLWGQAIICVSACAMIGIQVKNNERCPTIILSLYFLFFVTPIFLPLLKYW